MKNKNLVILVVIGIVAVSLLAINTGENPASMLQFNPDTQTVLTFPLGPHWGTCKVSTIKATEIMHSGGMSNDGTTFGTAFFEGELSESIQINQDCIIIKSPLSVFWGKYYWKVDVITSDNNVVPIMDREGVITNNGHPMAIVDDGYSGIHEWREANIDNSQQSIFNDLNKMSCEWATNNPDWYHTFHWGSDPYNCGSNIFYKPYGITFRLYGHYTGTLKVTLVSERNAWWYDDLLGWPSHDEYYCHTEQDVAIDEAGLVSGYGQITLMEPIGGVADEGTTAKFSATTGWSGTSSEWRLVTTFNGVETKIPGILRQGNTPLTWDSTFHGFILSNHLTGASIYWDIPSNAHQPGVQNEWGFKLYNAHTTLWFDILKVTIAGAKRPILNSATPDKAWDQYLPGDVATITVIGEGNPQGNNIADHFELWMYKGSRLNTISHIFNPPSGTVTKTGTNTWRTVFTITLPTFEAYTVDFCCYDGDPNTGANPSDTVRKTLIVQNPDDPKKALEVFVIDVLTGKPYSGLPVECTTQQPVYTMADGKALFPYMGPGNYMVSVHVDGYTSAQAFVTITETSGATATLKIFSIWNLVISIAVPVIILIIFIIIAVLLPVIPVVKIIILIVGIVIAAILYLILSGFINIPYISDFFGIIYPFLRGVK
jgi:hypothetical protein